MNDINNELKVACKKGYLTQVRYFLTSPQLKTHANINDDEIEPALTLACSAGHLEIVKYLLTSSDLKEHAKIKHHTFLVFCSGAVIMSSAGIDMENVYKEFMNLVLHNRNKFEEKIYSD